MNKWKIKLREYLIDMFLWNSKLSIIDTKNEGLKLSPKNTKAFKGIWPKQSGF